MDLSRQAYGRKWFIILSVFAKATENNITQRPKFVIDYLIPQ